ncbi:hypothetical protein J2S17_003409 [Cytobacillus purgationiresistens]|uniref:Uncharacterized protein n=1 Tax=Cytobacillus purgationiresistens TaxID=863449 RepID=A0ABU0ALB5_9BACI|nr:hypothetical protein [Cytobacillus purgationiresistens]
MTRMEGNLVYLRSTPKKLKNLPVVMIGVRPQLIYHTLYSKGFNGRVKRQGCDFYCHP